MPIIHIDLLDGKSVEQKDELISSVTEVTEKALGVDKEHITIILREVSRDHWAVQGKALTKKIEQ
ncbi:2-hydroxymuconate tautomerase [Siminovitchia sediminis]|uniref:Tautomerase n=1 Tax=Siminovitchia sediminis TaxID=1274353 RepID=A0ABW4KM00_9BACI